MLNNNLIKLTLYLFICQTLFYLIKHMTNVEQPKLSQEHLLQLITNKKYKQYKFYIAGIESQDEQIQNIVSSTLENILVKKTDKNPTLMFNALVLYKQLLITSCMDYITVQDIFPESIHLEIAKICEYNGKSPAFIQRGSNYFIQLFKIAQISDQKKKIIETVGNTYVLLALQLLKCISKWYPYDYDSEDETKKSKSIFKRIYDGLIKKGVTFPEQFKIMKPVEDEKEFMKNYKKFLNYLKSSNNESMAQNAQVLQKPKPQVTKATNVKKQSKLPGNSMNIQSSIKDNMIQMQNSIISRKQEISSIAPLTKIQDMQNRNKKQQSTSNVTDPSMIQFTKDDILTTIKQSSIIKPSQNIQNPKMNDKTDNVRDTSSFVRFDDRQSFAEQDSKQIQNKDKKRSAIQPIKNQIAQSRKNIPKHENPKKYEDTKARESIRNNNAEIIKQKQQSIPEIPDPFSFTSKRRNFSQATEPVYETSKNITNPKKEQIPYIFNRPQPKKIQIQQRQEERNALNISNQKQQTPNKPRTLPKTEKRISAHKNPNVIKPAYKLFQMMTPTKQNGKYNKTLSDWSSAKKAESSRQLQKTRSILQVVDSMRLDKTIIAYIPKYFQPLTSSMKSLRHESLNLFNSGISHNQFYNSNQIQARLIKQNDNVYILTIHNTTNEPLMIQYLDVKNIKFSNRIKILSWANNRQIYPYQVRAKGYIDIKFKFEVYDLNFKFLPFYFKINEKVENIDLPITLLDMCQISSNVSVQNLQKYALKGSILSSQPFIVGERVLPYFLGGFNFFLQNYRTKKDFQLIGQCSIKFERLVQNEYCQSSLQVLVKMVNFQKRLIEINILYITKDLQAEDLSKVILYLLIFMLKND